jgi:hypothetical protein
VLTGYSPQRLYDLRLIAGPSFEAARERARLTEALRRLNPAEAGRFDSRLLAELRRRHGPWTRPPA